MLGKRKFAQTGVMETTTAPDMGQAPGNALREIPRLVQYTSPVSNGPPPRNGLPRAAALPLNLIALIVSFLEDIGDISRVTRTSRLLYYMTLPSLYETVTLHSYDDIRYHNGRPEGFGSGSPFMMALNGLVTKQHASLVRHFRAWGRWKELGIDEFAKGRVPDNSMMLNILLRAAVDKMNRLQSFSWELNCKPLKTLYQGLGNSTTLTSLTLKFPSTRVPRPSVLIPPIPNLRAFKAMDIDPMCYPDDISMLMLHSKRLEDVRLHFSPRMRQEGEAVINLSTYFGRCHKANYKLKLKHFALQNFFGPNVLSFEEIFDQKYARSITFLDTFGNNDPKTVFVDSTWNDVPTEVFLNFEAVRTNEVAMAEVEIMKRAKSQLKYFYQVSQGRRKSVLTPSTTAGSPITPSSATPIPDPEIVAFMPEYLHTLTRYHGDGLRHLLLLDQWALSPDDVADLVRYCPNLEQLGLAINSPDHNTLRLLMPYLKRLRALRILNNEHLEHHMRIFSHEERMWAMGFDIGAQPDTYMEMISCGETNYKIGKVVELMRDDGSVDRRREMTMVGKEEAMKYDIWRLDCLDLSVDPMAPFSP